MSKLLATLKQEISRISRKEARLVANPLRRPSVAARTAIADLRRRVAALEKAARALDAGLARLASAQPPPQAAAEETIRVTAKGIRAMRRRLKLSAAELGRLLGVSDQAVYNLEKGSGVKRVRPGTRDAFAALRGAGVKGARQMLEAKKVGRKPKRKKRRR